eukprot:g23063.t1
MQWFASRFFPCSSVMRDSVLYGLFPGTHAETNIWGTISSAKDTLQSCPKLGWVFQIKVSALTECCSLAHSKAQDYVLTDTKAWGSRRQDA